MLASQVCCIFVHAGKPSVLYLSALLQSKLTLGGFFGGLAFLLLPYAMHVTRGYMLSWILHWPYLW